ncbi:hypothetical protein GCM10027445_61910 [Amycolatopsis endophytica]|uniref:Uncharacterized protein n=1 Tax=Amycolatopsis endophytica TaxID=860233 RepID=A0A853B3S2_9PSEU|nr:hypothetical protein [Amycolatopsis endophytica]NYI89660.1 hypothetical protein [Amycolatopsis endophytica]
MTPENSEPSKPHNEVHGEMRGVQAKEVHGDVVFNSFYTVRGNKPPELFDRRVSESELERVQECFVSPTSFEPASRVLRDYSVVVLHCPGTGRTTAGLRLLLDAGYQQLVHLSSDRTLGSIKDEELEPNHGYLWESVGLEGTPLPTPDLRHMLSLVSDKSARLVIIVNYSSQIPAEAGQLSVELKAPDPFAVAHRTLDFEHATRAAHDVLDDHLAAHLAVGDPPYKAARAAELAILIDEGELDSVTALRELTESVDQALEDIIDTSWSTVVYTMLLSVAFFHDKPFDDAAHHAAKLDELVRAQELPEDKTLRPRRVFAHPKDQLLRQIRATTETRDHPRHAGLKEQTVRFLRPDFAAAVLRRFWQQYHLEHRILLNWMCGTGMEEAAVQALCTVILQVPARDPLRQLDNLAASNSHLQRRLAVRTLTRLVYVHKMTALVKQTVENWVTGSVNRQRTAALVYASRYGRDDLERTLEQLGKIGRSDSWQVRSTVVGAVLGILALPGRHELVLKTVAGWVDAGKANRKNANLRQVGLELAMWVVGVLPEAADLPLNRTNLGEQYPKTIRTLTGEVVQDPDFGERMFSHLAKLAASSRSRRADQPLSRNEDTLLRVVHLLYPDLRWWARFQTGLVLRVQHPQRRATIRRILRTAQQLERRPPYDELPVA